MQKAWNQKFKYNRILEKSFAKKKVKFCQNLGRKKIYL